MTSKVLLLVAFMAGCGFTFFSALAWALVWNTAKAIKKILLDEV